YDANKVSYTAPINGSPQPRGAVIACAGFRQRYTRGWDATYGAYAGQPGVKPVFNREVLQEIEIPGMIADGQYKIVVEALASPCPFTGVMAHTDATIDLSSEYNVGGNNQTLSFRSYDDVRSLYGNEIINGQGSALLDYRSVHAPDHNEPTEVL